MKKKAKYYILFFVALFVTFYFTLGKIIPGFGKKEITTIGHVLPFSFTDQDGKKITEKDVAGKVFIAEYFFTTCRGICPRMNNNLKKIYERFKNEKDFLILSHTCNPETDSVAQLKHYSDSLGVSNDKWIFLTGRKDSLYYQARLSYQIDDPKNNLRNIDDDFLHTQFWALVNKKGEVKKIYDGLKESEVNQLISDIDEMLKE
ncbi:MAG TPA: SCO family protein [Chitinophagaceae bacterium]|nr:SCO family protein [Chitinophagaceae bacterium]